MYRSLLPSLLASLGLILITLATTMPLFEWQTSEEVVKDFSGPHHISDPPSPWITKLGESLNDGSYILRTVFVSNQDGACLNAEKVHFVVKRSPNEELLEQVLLLINEGIQWLPCWAWIEIILFGIYIWWFTAWHKRPISEAVISTVIAAVVFCFPTAILRLYLPKFATDYFMVSETCHVTIMFDARLSKVHYETLIVLFLGILGKLAALSIILHQLIKATIQEKESSKSVAG